MELSDWMPWYEKISHRLGLCREKDQRATDYLSSLLEEKDFSLCQAHDVVDGRVVIVFGAGPSLAGDVRNLRQSGLLQRCCLISANGATTAVMDVGRLFPDIVATDLDGRVEDQVEASLNGSILIVHAHSDNVPALERIVPRLGIRTIGSTQVEPRRGVHNFGGFTDGDRAAFLAVEFGARAVVLAGMDFGDIVGEYSKPDARASTMKMAKLHIGLELLAWLSTRTRIQLLNTTEHGVPIEGFHRAKLEEVEALLV
jgi:uncharacterized Rossmann fold enzyme